MWKNDHLLRDVEIDMDEPVYTSGVVCRLLEIPIWVLKQLDQERIVRPARHQGHDRLYSNRELKRLHYVWFLMEKKNVTISGIRVILEMKSGSFKDQ